MNAGVSTTPSAVPGVPARATPSLAPTVQRVLTPAAGRARARDRINGRGTHRGALGVHGMGSDVVGAQRLEGAGPHVQRDPGAVDAALAERLEQRLVEVQTRRGSGDRAGLARKEALVALAVECNGRAANVRRQRHRAEALEEWERRSRKRAAPQLTLPRQPPPS